MFRYVAVIGTFVLLSVYFKINAAQNRQSMCTKILEKYLTTLFVSFKMCVPNDRNDYRVKLSKFPNRCPSQAFVRLANSLRPSDTPVSGVAAKAFAFLRDRGSFAAHPSFLPNRQKDSTFTKDEVSQHDPKQLTYSIINSNAF